MYHNDYNGNPPVITANTIVANPDFDRIRASRFTEYHYEPFVETLKRYPSHLRSFHFWQEGIQKGFFRPQFHGREHLNVNRWMRALRKNNGNARVAFDYRMFDLSESNRISEDSFMEAFNFESEAELDFQNESIIDGLRLFEQIFGYRSITFIAPCNIWSRNLNRTLISNGVKAIQGGWYQFEPNAGMDHKFKKIFHYTGQKNDLGLRFLIRNASFELSQFPNFNFIDDVLLRMKIAFRWGKPVIIGSHRLNFIGFIDQKNRERNLPIFQKLLQEIVREWPDIEFISSDNLVKEIYRKDSQ